MAKVDLFHKRKFNRFAQMLAEDYAGRNRRLQAVAKILAIGFLETLWQKAYAEASEYLGDGIDVELAADWPGTKGSLIEMLLHCGGDGAGFIEEVPDRPGRYRIHDFWDHAPATVKRRRARRKSKESLGVEIQLTATPDTQAESGRAGNNGAGNGQQVPVCVSEACPERIVIPDPSPLPASPHSSESEAKTDKGLASIPSKKNGATVAFELPPAEKRSRAELSCSSEAEAPQSEREWSSEAQLPLLPAQGKRRREDSATPRPAPGKPTAGHLAPSPSKSTAAPPALAFDDEIELVFSAHEFGLRTFAEVSGQPFVAHSRSPAQRRRAIRQAIQAFGFDLTRQAARNLPLSPHHRGENERRRKYLEVECAMKDPESLAGLYDGPKEGLAEALRESLKTSTSSASENEDSTIADGASSVHGRQASKKTETSPTPTDTETGKAEGIVSRSSPSFFAMQESVFDAHDLGIRTLAEFQGRPFCPTDRKTAAIRRTVADAIRQTGVETARLAARNLVLASDYRAHEFLYMDISQALLEPDPIAAIFEGPDSEFEDALRRSLEEEADEADEGDVQDLPLHDLMGELAGGAQVTSSSLSA